MRKRLLALFLVFVMLFSVLPINNVSAADLSKPNTDADGVYLISSAGELQWFAALINGTLTDGTEWNSVANARLTADIDMSGVSWTPIGNCTASDTTYAYGGIFDGNGKTIKNLSVTGADTYYAGLFGYVFGGTVKNLTLADSNITHTGGAAYGNLQNATGAIVGALQNGVIEGCTTTGTVTVKGAGHTGGLAGALVGNTLMRNCTNNAKITAAIDVYAAGVGGLVGTLHDYNGIVIVGGTNNGDITVTGSKGLRVGGIAGFYQATRSAKLTDGYTIVGCGNTGKISATSEYSGPSVGGILGYTGHKSKSSKSSIVSCYNSGSVSSVTTQATANAGGIAGMLSGTAMSPLSPGVVLQNCLNVNTDIVTTNTNAAYSYKGAIIANINSAGFPISSNYYLTDSESTLSGYTNAGNDKNREAITTGYADAIVGKTAEELKSADFLAVLNGFDTAALTGYNVTWKFGANGYPVIDTVQAKAKSSACDITSFTFGDFGNAVINDTTITNEIDVALDADVTNVAPTIVVSAGATVSPASGVAQNFTNPVTYTVTAEDGTTTKVYTVTLNKAEDLTPKSFSAGGVDATVDATGLWNITFKSGTDLSVMQNPTVTFANDKITCKYSSANLNYGSYFYTVKGERSTGMFTVRVTMELNGSGTQEDPYQIATADDLKVMNSAAKDGVYYKQMVDIDMTGVALTPLKGSVKGGYFNSVYDGNGKTIKNLKITTGASQNYTGLFEHLTGTVKNLTLDDSCVITGGTYVGAFAGFNSGTIENCINRAQVTTLYSNTDMGGAAIGGFAGRNNGTIQNSINYGKVYYPNATTSVGGGIAGSNIGYIIKCSNFGEVLCNTHGGYFGTSASTAGGIAGNVGDTGGNAQGYIAGCANYGTVTGGRAGGVAGFAGNGNIESSYNRGDVIVQRYAGGGILAYAGLDNSAKKLLNTVNNCYSVGKITTAGNDVENDVALGQIVGQVRNNDQVSFSSNYFVGTQWNPAAGGDFVAANADAFVSVTDEVLKSADTVAKLNQYSRPVSLVAVTFAQDTANANGGYPIISAVKNIPNYHCELEGFAVGNYKATTEDGTNWHIMLPSDVSLAAVVPTITVSDGATVSPASGTAVNFGSGKVKFTVTAANGTDSKEYYVTAEQTKAGSGLMYLCASEWMGYGQREIFSNTEFSADKFTYDFTTMYGSSGGEVKLYAMPAVSTDTATYAVDGGEKQTFNFVSSSADTAGTSIALGGIGKHTVVLTVGSSDYTFNVSVLPRLEQAFTLTDNKGNAIALDKMFNGFVTEYQVNMPANITALTVKATAAPADGTVITCNGLASNVVNIAGADKLTIKVAGSGALSACYTEYTINLNMQQLYSGKFTVDPADAVVSVYNADGDMLQADSNGSYTFVEENSYTYSVSKYGYVSKTGTISSAEAFADGVMTVKLQKAPSSNATDYTGEWVNFRGNSNNMAIVNALTPKTQEEATLKWAVNSGAGWGSSPTPPIVINGDLYIASGKTIARLDKETGKTLAYGTLKGSAAFATNPVTYGEGMIFVPIEDGRVQAFRADTLESLWVTEAISGQQALTPVAYANGYIYMGTWSGETRNGYYMAFAVTDEAAQSPDEIKALTWKLTHTGGFYWAGAYVADNCVVFGSDNGTNDNSAGAVLYSVNPITGRVIDTVNNISGDIRSTVAYNDGYVYCTSKAGKFIKVQLNADGTFGEATQLDLGGASTGTPAIYNNVAFVGVSGPSQFGTTGHKVKAIDVAAMNILSDAGTPGYSQSSALISTAYLNDGKLYAYMTYNLEPGGVYVITYDTNSKALASAPLFTPDGAKSNYNISNIVCDSDGTLYFKNDSGYLMAVANDTSAKEAAKVEIATMPDKTTYRVGEEFDVTGLTVKITYNDDTAKTFAVTAERVSGFDSTAVGTKNITVTYGNLSATFAVKVTNGSSGGGGGASQGINVSFRLIGAEKATQDVDLGSSDYMPNYVTWIATKKYNLDKGSTVYDLLLKALADAGLKQEGAEDNYVATVYAPSALGGYALSEKDNGKLSGWMYTVNGSHPNVGVKDKVLSSGDKVVFHYVNDAGYEVKDWFEGSNGDASVWDGWLKAKDVNPSGASGGGTDSSSAVTDTAKPTGEKIDTAKLPFTDVAKGSWYYDAIKAMYDKGLMNGESATKFMPNNKLSRAMLVTILYRMQNEPTVTANALFNDVANGQWYTKAVAWASANNVVNGVGEGKFAPNDSVTRQEMAAMLYRYAKATGMDTTATASLNGFKDSAKVADWATDAMKWAVGSGLMKGNDDNTINLMGTATRAEVATVIVRLLSK